MTTLSSKVETKAKQEHRCSLCMDKIKVNEVYLKTVFIFEGDICNWKTHKHCETLAVRLKMYEDCEDGLGCDEFFEYVSHKHQDILIAQLPNRESNDYGDIIKQLRYVPIRDKMWFVIRFLNRAEPKIG